MGTPDERKHNRPGDVEQRAEASPTAELVVEPDAMKLTPKAFAAVLVSAIPGSAFATEEARDPAPLVRVVDEASAAPAPPPHLAEIVTEADVMKMLYKLAPSGPHVPDYGEIAFAIAQAATQDPLFPGRPDGSKRTATLLVALAFKESSFHRSIVGDHGRSFGLYQIQPNTHHIEVKLLTVPRDASFVAIDLMRQSFWHAARRGRPWHEGLAWYASSSDFGASHPKVVVQSMERVALADRLFREFFPEHNGESAPTLKLKSKGGDHG